MSHTLELTIDDRHYRIHHNGDWSGEVEIVELMKHEGDLVARGYRTNVSGKLLLELGRRAAFEEFRERVVDFIECIEPRKLEQAKRELAAYKKKEKAKKLATHGKAR